MFGLNIHRNLGQIHITSNATGSCNACLIIDLFNHRHRQFSGTHFIGIEIITYINKNLINTINMNILLRNILQIDRINLRRITHIVGHTWWRYIKTECRSYIFLNLFIKERLPHKPLGLFQSLPVDLFNPLINLKKTGSATYPVWLKRWRYRQTDSLLSSWLISHYQISGQRIKTTLNTLHWGIKRL